MELKFFSAEFVGQQIQLTYTDDGQAATQTGSMLVVRVPISESFNVSLNSHRMNVMSDLHTWAGEEYHRIHNETQGRA